MEEAHIKASYDARLVYELTTVGTKKFLFLRLSSFTSFLLENAFSAEN